MDSKPKPESAPAPAPALSALSDISSPTRYNNDGKYVGFDAVRDNGEDTPSKLTSTLLSRPDSNDDADDEDDNAEGDAAGGRRRVRFMFALVSLMCTAALIASDIVFTRQVIMRRAWHRRREKMWIFGKHLVLAVSLSMKAFILIGGVLTLACAIVAVFPMMKLQSSAADAIANRMSGNIRSIRSSNEGRNDDTGTDTDEDEDSGSDGSDSDVDNNESERKEERPSTFLREFIGLLVPLVATMSPLVIGVWMSAAILEVKCLFTLGLERISSRSRNPSFGRPDHPHWISYMFMHIVIGAFLTGFMNRFLMMTFEDDLRRMRRAGQSHSTASVPELFNFDDWIADDRAGDNEKRRVKKKRRKGNKKGRGGKKK